MIHPLLKVLIAKPDLIAEHVAGYGQLVAAQAGAAAVQLRVKAILGAVALVGLVLGVGFGGVALLLFGVVPLADMPHAWLLVVVPGIPLVAAIVCAVMIVKQPASWSLDAVRAQLAADAALLREASAR